MFFLLLTAVVFVILFKLNLILCQWEWKSNCIDTLSVSEIFELVRNIMLGIFGTIGLLFAYIRLGITDKQQQDSEDIQLNELHRQGAKLLGDDSLSTRIAGISTLRQLKSQDPERYLISVLDLLASYVVQSESKIKSA